ncbi:MAG: bifunctional DNA-formamidopyrimidine glycosylase/DNA-(apurinic or apyrimidinic site) lyase, partial [Verrucomicrobiota bacterium]
MPELPEVEVLIRHLAPLLKGKIIRDVTVRRARILRPTHERDFKRTLTGATFREIRRRGKYLLFTLRSPGEREPILLVGHLGMSGRMYLQPSAKPIAKHAAVIFALGKFSFIYEDTRYFGRLTLDPAALARLGPEPFAAEFNEDYLSRALRQSVQPIKVKLLEQSLVVGLGNIYASEALFLAGVPPRVAARNLKPDQVHRLWRAIRAVLDEAIRFGSTVPLDWTGAGARDGLFYYGRAGQASGSYEERLRVYDRAGKPCVQCGREIKRI